jgi:hypothetical protein
MYPKVSRLSYNKIYAYNNKHSLRSDAKGYGGKTHKIAIQLHLVAESCAIYSSHSRQEVWELLDTPLYVKIHVKLLQINCTYHILGHNYNKEAVKYIKKIKYKQPLIGPYIVKHIYMYYVTRCQLKQFHVRLK